MIMWDTMTTKFDFHPHLSEIEDMVMLGFSKEKMAAKFGINRRTIIRQLKTDPYLILAFEIGRQNRITLNELW